MSHINYDFLSESLLFSSHLEDEFAYLSDEELQNEIKRYREYVLTNMTNILAEASEKDNLISITIESFSQRPDDNLLKQLALYVDQILISDPLFELTEEKSRSTEVMAQFYGMKTEGVDRKRLADALRYMKQHTSLVVCDFVKFIPISFLHEAPKEVPIMYDKDNYKNALPQNVMNFLIEHIDVRNTYINPNGGLRVELEKPLEKGTGLYIHFPECSFNSGEIVQYQTSEIVEFNEKTGEALFRLSIPDSISNEEFSIWLNQSVNKACKHLYEETYQEFFFASRMNTMYLTQSSLKANLISMDFETSNSIQSKIANMALKVNVPVFQNMDISRIIDIRNNYGESFAVFRSKLGERLLQISNIQDVNQLENELAAVTYQINDRYVTEIKTEIKSLIRSIGIDAVIATGALITNNIMSGNNMISVVAGAIAAADGVKDSIKLVGDIRNRPGYFLWKMSNDKFIL